MTLERQEANGIGDETAFSSRIGPDRARLFGRVGRGRGAGAAGAAATTTERVVTNRFSGLAIEGYDPLAYFVDGDPQVGLPAFEAVQSGVVWRFRNEGNRDSFIAHPEIYGPQFGGYDPVDVARGVAVAGNPRFWLVAGDRLYLFGREDTRDAFAANPMPFLKEARLRWPALEAQLSQ